jgi:hypothetical protein
LLVSDESEEAKAEIPKRMTGLSSDVAMSLIAVAIKAR